MTEVNVSATVGGNVRNSGGGGGMSATVGGKCLQQWGEMSATVGGNVRNRGECPQQLGN